MHKEMCYMYAMDYYSPMRKKDNPAVTTTQMELEATTLSEISQI